MVGKACIDVSWRLHLDGTTADLARLVAVAVNSFSFESSGTCNKAIELRW